MTEKRIRVWVYFVLNRQKIDDVLVDNTNENDSGLWNELPLYYSKPRQHSDLIKIELNYSLSSISSDVIYGINL